MAGNISGLHVFTADVGPEALSLLDGNFTPLSAGLNNLNNFNNYYVDTGSVNALAVAIGGSQAFTLADGATVDVKVANTNTNSGPTLNVNGTGPKSITEPTGNGVLAGGLAANGTYRFIYNTTLASWVVSYPSILNIKGVPQFVTKPATTSRNSTTTLTNDPDLQINIGRSGIWRVELVFQMTFAASSGGLAANLNYTGSFTLANSLLWVTSNPVGGSPFGPAGAPSMSATVNNNTFGVATAAAYTGITILVGILAATSLGTLAFAWAQNNNTAINTNIVAGAWLTATQIA